MGKPVAPKGFGSKGWGSSEDRISDHHHKEMFSGSMMKGSPHIPKLQSVDCIVSTAACQAAGLPNDCAELNILRRFRDEYIKNLRGGRLLVKIYYKVGLRVVRSINKKPNRGRIYSDLYSGLVQGTVRLISQGKKLQALLRGAMIVIRLYPSSYLRIKPRSS